MGILIICAVLAIFAPQIAPYDPYAFGTPYFRPSKAHWLGTNDIGQDILSELIYGTRVSLIIGIICFIVVTPGFFSSRALRSLTVSTEMLTAFRRCTMKWASLASTMSI